MAKMIPLGSTCVPLGQTSLVDLPPLLVPDSQNSKLPAQSWVSKPLALGPTFSNFSAPVTDDRAIVGRVEVVYSVLANAEGPH